MISIFFLFSFLLLIFIHLHKKCVLPSFLYSKNFLHFIHIFFLGNFVFIILYYDIFNQLISHILISATPSLICLEIYYMDNLNIKHFDLTKLKNVLFSSPGDTSSSTNIGSINTSNQQATTRTNSPTLGQASRTSSPILEQISRANSPILDQVSRTNSPDSEQVTRSRSSSIASEDSVFTRQRPRIWGGTSNETTLEESVVNINNPTVSTDTSSRTPNPLFQGVNNYGVVSNRDKQLVSALVFRGAYIQNSIWHVDQIFDPTHVQQRFLNRIQSDSLQPFANNLANFLEHHTTGRHQETRFGYPSIHPITSLWLVQYHANNFPEVFLSDEWINIRNTDRILPSAMVNRPEEQIIADWGRPIVLFNDNTKRMIIEALRNER